MLSRRGTLCLMTALVSLACGRPSSTVPTHWTARPDAVGPVRIGMTAAEARASVGDSMEASDTTDASCRYIRPATLPPGVGIMVENDTVVRVDIDSGTVATEVGARVGDTEQRVLSLYQGQVRVQPHKYTGPTGHYLVVTPPGDSLHRIIFETDGAHITTFRVGRRPAVEYVERCG